jgi:DNA-binding HxlR family transcriptional regulator
MPMDISDVVRKKGMIEILTELQEGDRTFSQIMNAVRLSMSNIVARLREAEAYNLIKRVASLNNGKVEVKYTLTEKGETIMKKLMQNEQIGKLVNECRNLKKKANEVETELNQLLGETNLEI